MSIAELPFLSPKVLKYCCKTFKEIGTMPDSKENFSWEYALSHNIIYIFEEITSKTVERVESQLQYFEDKFRREGISEDERIITVKINSLGGDIAAVLAIHAMMKSVKARIATGGIGVVSAIGTLLLCAGTKGMRSVTENCTIILQPSDLNSVNPSLKESLYNLMSESTGQTLNAISELMDRNTIMSAAEAKDFGFVDYVRQGNGDPQIEAENEPTARRFYLEKKHQELIDKMWEEIVDEETDEEDFQDYMEDLHIEPERRRIIRSLQEGIGVQIEGERVFINSPDNYVFLNNNKLELICQDGKTYISDQGATMTSLDNRAQLGSKEVDDEIADIAEWHGIEIVGNEIRIEVHNPSRAISDLMTLYAAMERIFHVSQFVLTTSREKMEEDKKMLAIMKQLMQENTEANLKQIIRCARKQFNAVKNSADFDTIFDLASVIKELMTWTQPQFEYCRRELLRTDEESDSDSESEETEELPIDILYDSDESVVKGEEVAPVNLKALSLFIELGKASISIIQRKCDVGYIEACKIIDWMESEGYIGPFDCTKRVRAVLMTKEQFRQKYGAGD